ncbi:hypothetical protein CY35_07G033500 [Sphagnum magellanicum]|uniref:Uncharacterized protein n=1 Tax=Sphagnum magellanicum TaxID=128215 RepID=A0ACB8HJX6_9BRYO|nr:hypothetical protein CY35_07G033500 [Sphagnum magellanicum]
MRKVNLAEEPLLKKEDAEEQQQETTRQMGLTVAEWAVRVTMCAVFFSGVAFIAATSTHNSRETLEWLLEHLRAYPLGLTGAFLLLFGGPFLVLVIFAIISLAISSSRNKTKAIKKKVRGRSSLQNQPVVVEGLLGVMSAAELLWIAVFMAIFTWMVVNYMIRDFHAAETEPREYYETVWGCKVKSVGVRLGFIGIICLNLLFLPVSRGSVLFRSIDIPFEHATKYHVWLGHFVMILFTLHGLFLIIPWYFEGHLIARLLSWEPYELAILPGVIALVAGIMMWVTSLGWVRQKFFELFFYTHQLYIVFMVFMALHVGDFIFSIAFVGFFLFVFDRFLRFCQSRSTVGVLSVKLLPCGTYELVLAKPQGLKYHALSFVFINVPGISSLQWHPFSVSSSPYDGDDRLKVLIKPYGEWTHQLQDAVSAAVTKGPCPFGQQVAVEGPYGHESDYFLQYETLLMVAGGIGVSPFVAIIRDLLQRYQRRQNHLPTDVTLIWAVKKSEELQLLDLVSPSSICPQYDLKFNLKVHTFVTQEAEPVPLESGPQTTDRQQSDMFKKSRILSSLYDFEASKRPMSILVGTSSNLWVGMGLIASMLGYLFLENLVVYSYEGFYHHSYNTLPLWARGLFDIMSIILGVVCFGGSVIALWSIWYQFSKQKTEGDSKSTQPLLDADEDITTVANECGNQLVHPSNTQFGHRPDLKELFEACAKRQRAGGNVGVLVCGPETLQTSVAENCRSFNTTYYNTYKVGFSYHSVSFDL